MELLIPGLILVALMVYVSTRIKKSAARAFDTEEFENDEFSLVKPEGFLHKINDVDFAFVAYSKEFAPEPADNFRAARAFVSVQNIGLKEFLAQEKATFSLFCSEDEFEIDGSRAVLLSGEVIRNGHSFEIFSKIIEKRDRTVVLKIEVIKELISDFRRKTDEMLTSFTAK